MARRAVSRWTIAILLIGGPLLAIQACSPQRTETTGLPSDPLDQMVIAFEGNFTREQIQTTVDHALQLYGLPATDENRSRAGSTLVALRKEGGVWEMVILEFMICSYVDGVNLSFPEAAAIASAFLISGDRCDS